MNSFQQLFEHLLKSSSEQPLFEGWKDTYAQFVDTKKVPESVFNEFRTEDPSETKKYLQWMCKQYTVNPDRERHIIDVVKLFDQQVQRRILAGDKADIYKLDLESADQAAQQTSTKQTKGEVKREQKSESTIVDETDNYLIVVPESHGASCFYGANTKWCISGKTAVYWKAYYKAGIKIYIVIDKKKSKKYAVAVAPNGEMECFNEQDKHVSIKTIEKAIGVDFLVDKVRPASEEELSSRTQKYIQEIISRCTKNSDGTYSTEEDVDFSGLYLKHLPITFKYVGGNFHCDSNQLTTLEGAPQEVGRDFACDYNQLTTLEGAPQTVGGYFACDSNQLTTLEGAPQTVGGYFACDSNQLTTLEGAPQTVGGNFACDYNQLTTLEGAPQTVGGNFHCDSNQLTTLEGAPQTVGGNFHCDSNQLTTLEGAPQEVGRYFACDYNQLTTLEGAPQTVGGCFACDYNLVPEKELLKTIGR
jgi:hypothetical protein